MKLSTTVPWFCLVASVVGVAQAVTFDSFLSALAQLQDEAALLSRDVDLKDEELKSLHTQLLRCNGGLSDDTSPGSRDDDASSSDDDDSEDSAAADDDDGDDDADDALPNDDATTPGTDFTFSVGQTWNYNIGGSSVDTTADVDVFFIDHGVGQATIDTLHAKGKGVVCYISIGTLEEYREDSNEFPSVAIGKPLGDWPDEKWVDVNNQRVREIMVARVEKAAEMNCDAIEPDNMMVAYGGYNGGDTGVNVTPKEQIAYNTWFAGVVHAAGMSVGLKNAIEMIDEVVDSFDYALNEECHEWNECGGYKTFIDAGKPVFNVEYDFKDADSICEVSSGIGINTIFKDLELNPPFCNCDNINSGCSI